MAPLIAIFRFRYGSETEGLRWARHRCSWRTFSSRELGPGVAPQDGPGPRRAIPLPIVINDPLTTH